MERSVSETGYGSARAAGSATRRITPAPPSGTPSAPLATIARIASRSMAIAGWLPFARERALSNRAVSPRAPDPELRTRLIKAAALLLVEHGPDALTTRRVGKEVGASTMAIYTYFSGMADLRRAVSSEGFARLASRLDAVRRTDEPGRGRRLA